MVSVKNNSNLVNSQYLSFVLDIQKAACQFPDRQLSPLSPRRQGYCLTAKNTRRRRKEQRKALCFVAFVLSQPSARSEISWRKNCTSRSEQRILVYRHLCSYLFNFPLCAIRLKRPLKHSSVDAKIQRTDIAVCAVIRTLLQMCFQLMIIFKHLPDMPDYSDAVRKSQY